jgi:hypothetical protein
MNWHTYWTRYWREWKALDSSAWTAANCADCGVPLGPADLVYRRRFAYWNGWTHWKRRAAVCVACLPARVRQREPEACENCGRPMIRDIYYPLVCSGRCDKAQVNKRSYEKHREQISARRTQARAHVDHDAIPCAVCGKPFKPKRTDAKTCSNKCRQRAHRARQAAEPSPSP